MKSLGELRKEYRLTIDELALKAKVKNRTIEKIECEDLRYIDFQEVMKLQQFFNVENFEEVDTYHKELYQGEKRRERNGGLHNPRIKGTEQLND